MTELNEDRINAVLRCPAGDSNYAGGLVRLTGEQLRYCLEHETRVSGLALIQREIRNRKSRAEAETKRRHNGDPVYQAPPSFYEL